MNKSEDLLCLADFVLALAAALKDLGLESLPDRRAAALPDARAIRYYTSLGLLEPPLIRERKAHYHRGHQEQVLLLKLLQAQGQSLQQIQQQYYGLAPSERRALLQNLSAAQMAQTQQQASLPVALHWQEYPLAPGLRLQLTADYDPRQLRADLARIEAILKQVRPVS